MKPLPNENVGFVTQLADDMDKAVGLLPGGSTDMVAMRFKREHVPVITNALRIAAHTARWNPKPDAAPEYVIGVIDAIDIRYERVASGGETGYVIPVVRLTIRPQDPNAEPSHSEFRGSAYERLARYVTQRLGGWHFLLHRPVEMQTGYNAWLKIDHEYFP